MAVLGRSSGCTGIFRTTNLVELAHQCIDRSEALLAAVRRPATREDAHSVIDRLDAASNNLCTLIDYAEAVLRLSPGTEYSKSARKAADAVFKYMSQLNADRRIYTALVACLELNSFGGNFLSPEHVAVGRSFREEFEAIGIALPIQQRASLLKLQQKIQAAINRFEGDSEASSAALFEVVQGRRELARLLGFDSYANLTLRDHVLQDSSKVLAFLSRLQKRASLDQRGAGPKGDYQSGLSFKECLALLNNVCIKYFRTHFSLQLEQVWGAKWWRVRFQERKGGAAMGDAFISTNFRFGPCHFPLRTWRNSLTHTTLYGRSKTQTPLCMITFGPEDCEDLKFSEIQSLFHEFGHALHTVCAKTHLHHLSGTRCKLDFAEIPSSLMELFALEYKFPAPTTSVESSHVLGRLETWRRSVRQGESLALTKQLILARFDQFLHGPLMASTTDSEQFERAIHQWLAENSAPLGRDSILLPNIRSFRHVCVYGASYYCYLFSSRAARHIWDRYMDPASHSFSPHRFHDQALRFGGTKATRDILADLELTDLLET